MDERPSNRDNSDATQQITKTGADKRRSSLVRVLISAGRIGAFGYVTLLCMLLVMEDRLIYPAAYMSNSRREIPDDPEIRTVSYQSADGTPLSGRLLERDQHREVIVYFHGNGTKAIWLHYVLHLISELYDATVLAAEYRGFMEDNQTPTPQKLAEDGVAASEFLQQKYNLKPNEIILYGSSLGGGVAAAVAGRSGARALVLERTFDQLTNAAAAKYPFLPVRYLMRNEFDSKSNLRDFRGPVVQMHGKIDRVIAHHLAENLFASLTTKQKRFFTAPEAGHNDLMPLEIQQQAADTLRRFLSDAIAVRQVDRK